MLWNNLVLLSVWAIMCWYFGAALFFTIYLLSVSIAGGLGIVLFTVQHNFRAFLCASAVRRWDYDTGAIEGTSFLVLPGWLNFFTANIGYHHIHHLSSSIPSYRLVACHNEYQHLFPSVARVQAVGSVRRHEMHPLGYPRASDHHLGGVPAAGSDPSAGDRPGR